MKITAVEYLVDRLVESGIDFLSEEIEFINQAKEMEKQQQGYSEEELLVILHKRDMYEWEEENEILSVTDWFEQFKKK